MVGGVYLNLFIAQPHWVSIKTELEILDPKIKINITQKILDILGIKKTERIFTRSHGQILCTTSLSVSGCKSVMILFHTMFSNVCY